MRTRQRLRALAAHLAPARSGPADGHSEEESLSLPLSFPPPPSLSHTAASTEEIYRAPMTPASLGGALQPLRDSSALLDDTAALRFAHFVVSPHSFSHTNLSSPSALRARLAEDGYLFLPGFHGRAAVMGARRELLE